MSARTDFKHEVTAERGSLRRPQAWTMDSKQFLVEFVQVISVGQPSTARENCPATRGPAGKWTQARAGERHRKTSEPRIQSWRRPAVARAGGGGAKRPTQREAPRARSRAVSVRTSAKGAHARSAGGRASASTSAEGGASICQHQRQRTNCKDCRVRLQPWSPCTGRRSDRSAKRLCSRCRHRWCPETRAAA